MCLSVKTCTKCKEVKTVNSFYKDKNRKDGLQPSCKTCASAAAKIYYEENKKRLNTACNQYYLNNTEKMNATSKQYRLDNAEKVNTYKKQYCLDNIEKISTYKKQYWIKNAEKLRADAKLWRIANPEKHRQSRQARRARKLANGVYEISSNELKKLYESSCVYCGSKDSIQADHVVPIARGGTHSIGNLVPACARCNQSKGSKLLTEWKASLKWAI